MKSIKEGFYPSDLKDLSIAELEALCGELRSVIIETVAHNGGHLASNLGVVELTVAMHRVFNAPQDKIVWDVGHQSYVHKLLTGRGPEFDSIRKLNGLSGFPKRSESEYDTFDTGHSSNSVSAALGMAAARDALGQDYSVAAVIGDGAMTGGMVYEALNNAGVMDTGLVVVLNDNAMSISKDHGGLSQHLAKLRSSEGYNSIKKGIKSMLHQVPGGNTVYSGLESIRDAVKYMVVPGVLFEELGFTYLGPVDGHNIEELIDTLSYAVNMKKPVLVHCMTQKGKGYRPAELHPDRFHGVSPFDKRTGKPLAEKSAPGYSDIFGHKLARMAESDKRIVAISAAMVDGTGLSSFARRFPDRIFDTGIAEEHAVTFAAGLAAAGMRPFVAIYSTFLQRAYDQILIDVCMQKLPVTFCIDRAGLVGADGETHHGVFDLSYLLPMPEMTILAPSNASELQRAMEYSMTLSGPCAIRYPRGTASNRTSESTWKPVPEVKQRGADILIVGVGRMTEVCEKAISLLDEERASGARRISAGLIDARILKPLKESDIQLYKHYAVEAGAVLVVEDNVRTGGFGNVIRDILSDCPNVKIYQKGWPDEFIAHGSVMELDDRYGMTFVDIAKKVREIVEGKA